MKIPSLTVHESKSHWSYSDNFGTEMYEYIKSFVHNEYTIGYHTHSFYELNIVLTGEGYHYIEQMSCHAKAGCVFLIPPYIKHGYINQKNLNVYHMLIHRDFIENCFGEFKKTAGFFLLFETEPYLRAHYKENMFLILTSDELMQVKQDIEIIKNCSSMQNSNIFINAIAKKILCYLCILITEHRGINNSQLQTKKELMTIADCLNYIHQNFDQKLTVIHLSNRMNMSRSTFIRQFKKICGCPPHEYIQQYRIKKAREYLKNTNKTSSYIAQECGFYDVSHMQKHLSTDKIFNTGI